MEFSDSLQITYNSLLQLLRIAEPESLSNLTGNAVHQVDGPKQRRPIRTQIGACVSLFQSGPKIGR